MTSTFDPDQGRLVMSRAALQGLAVLESGSEMEPDTQIVHELVEAGIVQEGRVHEGLIGLARCLSRPLVRLIVERTPHPATQVDGWIDDRLAVLLHVPSQATEGDVVAVPRGMTGFRLARLMQLGPRATHKVSSPIQIDAGLLEVLLLPGSSFEPDDVERLIRPGDDVEPAWLETLAALSGSEAIRWNAGVWWNSADERPKARTLELVDSTVGMFLVTVAPRGVHMARRVDLRPVTPSQMWRLLCALVPPGEEVSEPLDMD